MTFIVVFMRKLIRKIWRALPAGLRSIAIRVSQDKFTLSVAAVIIDDKNRVLVLDHVLRPKSGWGIPGGFVEHGEQPLQAIRREIKEETNIELVNPTIYCVRTLGRHIEIIFTAEPKGEVSLNSSEIIGFEWFDPELLPEEMNSGQKHLIRKVLNSTD